jgi:CheY-like chemotaxis protein
LPRQLLAFVRDEPRQRRPVDVNALLMGLADMLRPRHQGRVALDYHLHPGGAWVEADSVQLTQAVLNLAGNALDAMPGGGRLGFETELVEVEAAGKAFVRIAVRDTGPGIPPEVQARLFSPLVTSRRGDRGSGLGLTVVQTVVQEHGGWVGCQSDPGQGACFVIHLPAVAAPAVAAQPEVTSPPAVLVVESDPDMRRLACMILDHGGPFPTIACPDLAGALKSLETTQREKVGLVLVDAALASRHDWEGLTAVLSAAPSAALLLTSTGREVAAPPAVRGQLRGVLTKPFGAEMLLCSVRKALQEEEESSLV